MSGRERIIAKKIADVAGIVQSKLLQELAVQIKIEQQSTPLGVQRETIISFR